MKKYLLILAAGLITMISSCGNDKNETTGSQSAEAKIDPAVQKNLEATHAVNKAFESGDFASVRKYIDDNAVDHAGPDGDVKGGDNIITALTQWTKMTTNMKSALKKEFADNEIVIQWMTVSGKMVADGFGMKAGDVYSQDVIEVTKFNSDNKATEHWEFSQMSDIMKMMGGGQPGK